MQRRVIIFIAIISMYGSLTPTYAQSLDDVIRSTLQSHPRVTQKKAAIDLARASMQEVRSSYGPQINLQLSASSTKRWAELQNSPEFDDSANPLGATLSLQQQLYTGGSRTIQTRLAKAQMQSFRYEYQNEELVLVSEVANAWFDAALSVDRVKILDQTAAILETELAAAEARYERDIGTVTDIALARASLAEMKAYQRSAEVDANRAKQIVRTVGGLEVFEPSAVNDLPPPPFSLEEAVQRAMEFAPSLKAGKSQIDQARFGVVAAQKQNSPKLALSLQASAETDPSPAIRQDDNLSVALTLSIPLYDSGAARAGQGRALAGRRRAYAEYDESRQRLELSVTDYWAQANALRLEISAQEERVTATGDALKGLKKGQEAGLWSTLDVLEATRQHATAQIAQLDARTQYNRAAFQLRLLCGMYELW